MSLKIVHIGNIDNEGVLISKRNKKIQLEELIGNRTVELEDALGKLKQLEESLTSAKKEITVLKTEETTEEVDEIVEEIVEEVVVEEEQELPIIRELRSSVETNLKIVVHLKEMTKQIVKLYDVKTMKRFDLEKYFKESTIVIDRVDSGLRKTAKKLSGQDVSEETNDKFKVLLTNLNQIW